MAGEPRVAIAIVSTNEADNLLGVLGSLSASEHRDFAVFICENGGEAGYARSTEALAGADVLEAGPRDGARARFTLKPGGQPVTLINPGGNRGYAGGTNTGIEAARAEGGFDAFWVLNPDTFPEPAALGALVRRQREGGFGMVGSRLVFTANGRIQMWGGFSWNRWLAKGRQPFGYFQAGDAPADVGMVEGEMDVVSGASMYATRDYVEQVGLMDDKLFVFCEDSDWSLRRGAFTLGYAHDSVIHHVHGATSGSSFNKRRVSPFNTYLTARNRIWMVRREFGAAWPVAAMLIFVDLGRYPAKGAFANYGVALSGWWAGVRGKSGPPPMLAKKR